MTDTHPTVTPPDAAGGRLPPLSDGRRLWWPDGSSMVAGASLADRMPPPADPYQRLKHRREYHTLRRAGLAAAVRHLRGVVEGARVGEFRWPTDGRYGPPPATPGEALAQLQGLHAAEVRMCEAIAAEMTRTPHPLGTGR